MRSIFKKKFHCIYNSIDLHIKYLFNKHAFKCTAVNFLRIGRKYKYVIMKKLINIIIITSYYEI